MIVVIFFSLKLIKIPSSSINIAFLIQSNKFRWLCFFRPPQRGHIYTSSGSFFIEPIEPYTPHNQNILHKISREKLPIDKVQFDKQLGNGKILIDEYIIGEDRVDDAPVSDYNVEAGDYNVDGQYGTPNNSDESFVFCKTANDKSK